MKQIFLDDAGLDVAYVVVVLTSENGPGLDSPIQPG